MDRFLEYLRAHEVPDAYLSVYRAEAETFLKSFPHVRPVELEALHVAQHLDTAQRVGATERALRNLRTVCDALLAFIDEERARIGVPPRTPLPTAATILGGSGRHAALHLPTEPPPTPTGSQSDHRRFKRVPFIKEVEVVGVGRRRCSDISVGGMYLETVNTFPLDTLLTIRFKLRDSDDAPVTLRARVAYEHPGLGLGLDFVNLTPDDRDRIVRFVEGAG